MTPREIGTLVENLGHDERAVAEMLLKRLAMGREQYGELRAAVDQRDFHWEALQEFLDAAIYLSVATYRLGPEEKPAEPDEDVGDVDTGKNGEGR